MITRSGPWLACVFCVSLLVIPACRTFLLENDSEAEARRQLELAHMLETAGDLREASHEYIIIAERYPGSIYFEQASRKAGYLYADPGNPARNDSVAIHWLHEYLRLPLNEGEKEYAGICLRLLERSMGLRTELERLNGVQDSLDTVVKRQASNNLTLTRRVAELELETAQTARELQKIKEIDSRSKRNRR
jgi:hypothetical protein